MINSDRPDTIPAILRSFAGLLGTEIKDGRLDIPPEYGSGYCRGVVFNEYIRMIISNYVLKEDLVIRNPEVNTYGKVIFFKFQHIISGTEASSSEKRAAAIPSVLIATSRLNTDQVVAIHSNTATINIEVDSNYLNGLFHLPGRSSVLDSLLQNTQPLLFEQIIYPSLQNLANEIMTETIEEKFRLFYLRIKAEELICRLLMQLEKRQETSLLGLNSKDIQHIYQVKEEMLAHLDTPPAIKDLAVYGRMSPTKLKRLFKQIFGNSIFNYYQTFRMQEAARLLKEENLSVAEVGYQLGFSNLSHFGRLFEQHIGMKPKKYAIMSID